MAKVTGPNQFSLAVGHRTTAKVDDCSYTWICSTWQKMSMLHIGDIASYMYLFYVTKNVCVTYWWYGYMYVNCKSGHYLMLHIYVSVLWDKNLYVIYIGDIAMISGHLGTRYWIIKIIWFNFENIKKVKRLHVDFVYTNLYVVFFNHL